jgi:hypothetical protein
MIAAAPVQGAFPRRGAVWVGSVQRIQTLTPDDVPLSSRVLRAVPGWPIFPPIWFLFDGLTVWHTLRVLLSPLSDAPRFFFELVTLSVPALTCGANPLHWMQSQ